MLVAMKMRDYVKMHWSEIGKNRLSEIKITRFAFSFKIILDAIFTFLTFAYNSKDILTRSLSAV